MFQTRSTKNGIFNSTAVFLSLVFHSTVRGIRSGHGNAVISIVLSILQSLVMLAVFFLMFTFIGGRVSPISGAPFILYLMSGILLFVCHTRAISAIMGAPASTSAMMKHAPLNTAVAIIAAALGTLYTQTLSIIVILFVYHAIVSPIEILYPAAAARMVLLAWFSGCVIGLIFYALKPWFPNFVQIGSQVYIRINMISSGKMFIANALPGVMVSMFSWNPLFHCIDQLRGFVFLNYTPHKTSAEYPIYFSLSLIVIGLLGEFYTRKYASVSWDAKR